MFNKVTDFINKVFKKEGRITEEEAQNSRAAAKDRLHIVLMQDRANISADFLDLMREEIIEVIKRYIVVDEKEIDVRLTHSVQEDGTPNPPSLYANIPILNIRNDMKAKTEKEKRESLELAKKEEKEKKKQKSETKDKKVLKEDEDKKDDKKINIIIDKAEEVKKEATENKDKSKAKTKETEEKEKKK